MSPHTEQLPCVLIGMVLLTIGPGKGDYMQLTLSAASTFIILFAVFGGIPM